MKKLYLFFAVLCSLLGAQTAKANIVYFDDQWGSWGAAYAHMWNSSTNTGLKAMTKLGGTLYAISSTGYNNIIFAKDSNWTNKTADLTLGHQELWQGATSQGAFSWNITIAGSTQAMTFDSSTNTYSVTVEISESSTTTLKIRDSLNWYNTFIGATTLTDNATISASYSSSTTATSSHTLSAGTHTITWNPLSKKITDVLVTPAVTETGRTLEALALHKSGGSDTGTITKVSDTEWTLGQTQIEVGKDNSYYLTATYTVNWSDGSKTTETIDYVTGSSSSNAVSTATAYSLQKRSSNYFYFNYKNYMTTTGTITITDEVPTAVTFTEVESEHVVIPEDPIITLRKSDGTIVGTFAKTSDNTYELGKTTITIASDSYKIGFQASSSDDVTYYSINSNGYWIGQKTYDIVNTSYTFKFGSSTDDSAPVFTSTSVIGIVTLSNDVPATMYFTEPLADGVNLPLTAADFANGKKHYFLVGTRTGDWHLQPEWELQEDANGNFVINNSLLYTGYYAIAVVDNYFNYAKNRYTAYATEWAVKSGATSSISLSKQSYTGPSAYGSQADTFTSTNCLAFVYYTYAKTSSSVVDNMTILQSLPTFVESIEVSVSSDGTPSKVSFNGCSLDQTDINNELVFSLVGNLTTYENDDYDVNPVELASKTQRATNVKDNLADWQEGWIQFDKKGDPYVDGNGNYLYHTRFQREYLLNHPTSFKYNGVTGGAKFPFLSDNILFVYNEELSKDESRNKIIGDDSTNEECYIYGTTGQQTREVTSGSTFSCFTVEDMWVDGEFKLWTGWGGVTKQGDANMGNGDKNTARWYYENGGHSGEGKTWTVSPNIYYGTERDVNGANFTVDKRRFFKRVEMWYDPSAGFTNSIIHLVVENGGPNIYALQTGRNAIDYSWNIPDEENQAQNYDVKEIRIYRMVLDAAGNPTSTTLIETVGSWAEGEKKASEFKEITTVNDPGLNFGTYQYSIEVDYYEGGTGESEGLSDDGTYFTREAKSNKITLRAPVLPDECEVIQLVYSDAAGETEVTDASTEKYYSFDLRLSANAPSELNGVKSTTYTDKDVLSCVKYYVIAAPASTPALYSSIEVEDDNTLETGLTKAILKSTYGFSDDDLTIYPDDATLLGVAPMGSSDNYRMPNVVLKNVIPGDYTFLVGMVSQEDIKTEWALLNVATATASVEMYVPNTYHTASAFTISAVDEASANVVDGHLPLGTTTNQPVAFQKANKLSSTNGAFAQLAVTDGVLTDWALTYTVKLTDPTDASTTYTYTMEDIQGKALNATNGISADFDYLPVPYSEESAEFDKKATNTTIQGINYRKPKDGSLSSTTTVGYKRTVEGATTDDVVATSTESSSSTMSATKYGNYDALKYYEAEGAYVYQVQGSYENGKVEYFTNAFASITWTANTTLNNAAGYYAASTHDGSRTGYYVENNGYVWNEFPAEGGEVTYNTSEDVDDKHKYDEAYRLEGYTPGNAASNFAEIAATVGKMPIKVWYVGDGDTKPASILETVISAEYPMLVKPTLSFTTSSAMVTASVEDGAFTGKVGENGDDITDKIITLSYPELLTQDLSGTTTVIENLEAEAAGDFRIWPNPAVDVVNVAASAALGTIEIYAVDGRLVKTVEVDDTHAALEVSDLVKGTYIIRAAGASQRMIKK